MHSVKYLPKQLFFHSITIRKVSLDALITIHSQIPQLFLDTEQLVVILNTNYEDIDVKLHVRRIGVKNHEIMRRVMLTNEEGYSLETCDYKVEHNMLYMKVPKMSAMVLVNVGRDV